MRFHWGLGIGHIYSHHGYDEVFEGNKDDDKKPDSEDEVFDIEVEGPASHNNGGKGIDDGDDVEEEEEDADYGSALGMEDRENDNWMDSDSDVNEEDDGDADDDDAEFLEKYDMYGL